MTLNGVAVVVNQNGTLVPIPHHAMTEGGTTVYKVLQPHTVLDMYYTSNYDGKSTPAFIIIGNPIVLSSADYTIYADGSFKEGFCGDVKPWLSNAIPYGWLLCDNTVRNKSIYPRLWNVIPDKFKNTSNNTFVIDLREATLKGTGLTSKSSAHYNTNGLSLGEFINDRVQEHYHDILCEFGANANPDLNPAKGTYCQVAGPFAFSRVPITAINSNSGRRGPTTEVKAVGVNWIIKF